MTLTGKTVSHYQILDQVGSGGMGIVYRARDTVLDREVALKFLPPDLSRDETANERFMREARAASALEHPNICTIYEVGTTEDGQLFIAMPFYRGQTLKHALSSESHAQSEDETLAIVGQVAEGLAAAHDEGIVHRDIKPDNIMITERGRAVILDFGLAMLPGALSLTRADSTVGTAAYMSPEQIQGKEVGSATDLWSLGVVLYELLSGHLPFEGDYEQALSYSILNTRPDPVDGLSPQLQEILDRLLEKDAQNRYRSASELIDALQSVEDQPSGMPAAPTSGIGGRFRPARKTILAGSMFALVAIVVATLAIWLGPQEQATPPYNHSIGVLPFAVRGSAELDYLGEGLVDLLSMQLDGAGDIQAVDPNSIIGRIEKDRLDIRTPQEATRLARKLGAAYAVLGRVNSIGSSIQLSATVYDGEANTLVEAESEAESEDGLQAAVERIASQIVTAVLGLESDQVAFQGVASTESIDALKAYLAGEQEIRRGRFRAATDILQEAVAADSLFPLAWARLSFAAGWGIDTEIEQEAMEKAYRLRHRMNERNRIVTEARYLGMFKGEFELAVDMLRSLLLDYPNDLLALQLAGEIIFHSNATIGLPNSDALPYFRRAVELGPDHGDNIFHLIDILRDLGRNHEADSMTAVFVGMDTSGSDEASMLETVRIVAKHNGIPSEQDAPDDRHLLFRSFDGLGTVAAWNTTAGVQTEVEDLQATRELMQRLVDRPDASELVRDFIPTAIAKIDLAEGRYGRFVQYHRQHRNSQYASTLLTHAMVVLTPTYPVTREALLEVRDEIAGWDTTRYPPVYWVFELLKGEKEAARQYILAMLAYRLEDETALQDSRRALEELTVSRDGTDPAFVWLRSVDAAIAYANGDDQAALDAIAESVHRAEWRVASRHLIKGLRNNVILKGEILARQGRLEEALRAFDSIRTSDNRVAVPFYGLAYFRSAQIHEQLGHLDEAMEMYSQLMKLWGNADPQYKEYVREAASSLDRLVVMKAREPT